MFSNDHEFSKKIASILSDHFEGRASEIMDQCEIIRYLNFKTRAADRGSKSRAGFANHYAIYVLLEDYIKGGFQKNNNYCDYEGAKFSDLLQRQRRLPFGSKLQNHALNHRLNEEFRKLFPSCEHVPVIRDPDSSRYWINEKLIKTTINKKEINLASAIIAIIDAYILARKDAFSAFMKCCRKVMDIQKESPRKAMSFVRELLCPNVDARIFEIVSFAVLKGYYADQKVFWGWSPEKLVEESLTLHKTGRTNANDGGIDFVMKPLGRFFQVTETVDVGKYFLDIDKVLRYPVTFVVKTNDTSENILKKLKQKAQEKYFAKSVVRKYVDSIEEIINIPRLVEPFEIVSKIGRGAEVMKEIVVQSKLEFHVHETANE